MNDLHQPAVCGRQSMSISCRLAGGTPVTLWLQRHAVTGIGGLTGTSLDVPCELEDTCRHRIMRSCPARRLNELG